MTKSVAFVLVVAGTAFAAPPPNDLCPGAEVIPSGGTFPKLTAITPNVDEATSTGDQVPSCQSSVSRGVWYTFTPASAGTFLFSTCADAPTGSTVDDTVIALYTSAAGCSGPFTQVAGACDDDSCATETFQSVVGATLAAGTTYYVVVYTYGTGTLTPGNTAIQLRVGQTLNDVCGAAAAVQLDTPVTGSTSGALDDYRVDAGCPGGVGAITTTAPGRDLAFSFTPAASGKFSWRVRSNGADDLVLHVANSCPAGAPPVTVNSCLAVANRNTSTSAAEETSCLPLTSGTAYFGFVDAAALTAGSSYELEINACVPEVEPNNTPATAGALACGLTGGIVPVGDVDFFDLGATPGRVFAAIDGLAGASYDFDLRVTTATSVLEYDDGDMDTPFGVYAPAIAGTVISGQSYLKVSHFFSTSSSEPYRLYAVVQPPSASAIPEVEPNDSPATATQSGLDYFSGALSGASPSTDVDVYAVPAVAGELLFVALDGDPLRNSTPLNAKLELLDATGAVLLTVNDSNATSNPTLVSNDLAATSPSSPAEALIWRVRATGTHYVRVTAGATSTTANAGDYLLSVSRNCQLGTLGPAPTLTSILPNTGPIAGATSVTLTGTNFAATSTVTLGGLACSPAVNSGSTSLTCPTPAHAPGAVDVVVTNLDGQKATLAGGFTYVAGAPTISLVTPSTGPTSGSTPVTVTGSNFFAGAVVTFGANAATSVVVGSSTSLTCFTPASATAGAVDVKVVNLDAQQVTLDGGFTYTFGAPTLTAVNPNVGTTLGGTSVTVQGTNFQVGATVSFGGFNGTVTNTTPTAIVVTTPAHAAGAVTVVVVNPDAQAALLVGGFTYVAPPAPTVTSVTPANGLATGNTGVTIAGTNFGPGATVQFGGANAVNVVVNSAVSISASTPPHAAGAVDVVVKNVDNQFGTLTNGFTFIQIPAPTLTAVTPSSGGEFISRPVTLTGSNFQNGATVSFNGTPATNVSVVSVTQINCSTPALAAGAVDVTVTNPDNQTATLAGGYAYLGGADGGVGGGSGGSGGGSGGSGGGSGGSGGGSGGSGGGSGGSGGGSGGSGGGSGGSGGGSGGSGGGSGGSGGGSGGSGGGSGGAGGGGPPAGSKGCGCNQGDAGTLLFGALALTGLRRRRRLP